ncbi:hypothetical protein KSP39_PZI007406 [Platanthera zijinensis]|uniref:GPN-loop GTPase 3 n=1 Tax=Platanthera zijinensis TaxID=2320716 RepID=A0AAP0BNN2_9ASPA
MYADIRELISVDDAMEDLNLGPNGGLMYCMEYPLLFFEYFEVSLSKACSVTVLVASILFMQLEDNLDDWLEEELDNFLDDDYLVFDCPGIILYKLEFHLALLLIVFSTAPWKWEENFHYGPLVETTLSPRNLGESAPAEKSSKSTEPRWKHSDFETMLSPQNHGGSVPAGKSFKSTELLKVALSLMQSMDGSALAEVDDVTHGVRNSLRKEKNGASS